MKKSKTKLSKISRIKKVILLGLIIGVLMTTIITPIVVIKINQKNEQDWQKK